MMKKQIKAIIWVVLVFLFGSGLPMNQSLAAKKESKTAEAKPEKIRFMFNGGAMGLSQCVFYIAVTKNFLQEEFGKDGIALEYVKHIGSGTNAASAIGAGQADFATIGDQPVIVSRANGIDIKAVGVYAQGLLGGPDRYIALMVRNDSKIKSIKDLKGKKVAVSVGTNQHVVLARYLNKFGLKQSDIQLVNMEGPDIRTALASGSLEAGMLSQPNIAIVESKGIAHMLDDKAHLTKNYNVYVVANEFAKKYPSIVRRVLQVHIRAKKWIDEHPDEFLTIAADSLKLEKEIVKKALLGLKFDLKITKDTVKSFEITQQFLLNNSISRRTINVKDAFDTRYLKSLGVTE